MFHIVESKIEKLTLGYGDSDFRLSLVFAYLDKGAFMAFRILRSTRVFGQNPDQPRHSVPFFFGQKAHQGFLNNIVVSVGFY